ncbi:glycosyltransferase family 4 protein [Haloglycomyces albus]|uniref:glycosyltransferase family 4 protein n=1 Tax=Haloglycomyces albus TaxID=526067 RepID=UPI001B7FAC68|nr:glycosyltransferase family 4 protein [Haloglycomyces albus]
MNRRIALVLGPSTGGIGMHVASIAKGLLAKGDAVTVIGPPEVDDTFGFRALGARFLPVPMSAKPSPALGTALTAAHRALHGINERGYDLIHAHGLTAGIVALANRPSGAAFVTTWHNQLLTEGVKRTLSNVIEARLARRVDVALAASSDLQQHLIEIGARDARLAPVAAPPRRDTGDAAAINAELRLDGRPLILSVGRLHEQKDYDTLVAAAERWRTLDPSPVVAIAGSGDRREHLEQLIESTGADVRLLGHRTDIADLLAAADLALVTSRWEARQLFAQEAMQAGVPLVATRTGGIPELVGDSAELFSVGDVDGLDKIVTTLLNDSGKRERLAESGRELAASWPTENDTIDALDALYRELTGR